MNALSPFAGAVVLGFAFALGVLLVLRRVPRWSAPTLSRRIAPYVRDVADPAGLTPLHAPQPSVGALGLGGVRDRLVGAWGGGDALARRLRQAGMTVDVAGFRARQLAWAGIGLAGGAVLAVVATLGGGGGPVAALLPPVLAAIALVVCEQRVTRAARRRSARIEDELPTVLEFLSLCLSAGESLREALRRVGDVGSGVLAAELRTAVLVSGTGTSLPDALTAAARDADVPALSRAVEHLVAAIDRGAPLAHVLQDQAVDAREEAKRSLIEAAGRKEIFMLLPLVFLILPLSVLFAVFPGVVMLRLGIG